MQTVRIKNCRYRCLHMELMGIKYIEAKSLEEICTTKETLIASIQICELMV